MSDPVSFSKTVIQTVVRRALERDGLCLDILSSRLVIITLSDIVQVTVIKEGLEMYGMCLYNDVTSNWVDFGQQTLLVLFSVE